MLKSIEGVYRKGKIELTEVPVSIGDETRVIVTFLENGVHLRARGIDEQQAADLRARLASFVEDWVKGEVEIYLIAHAAPQGQPFALPKLSRGQQWRCFVDTAAAPASYEPGAEAAIADQRVYQVSGDSVVVLVSAPE